MRTTKTIVKAILALKIVPVIMESPAIIVIAIVDGKEETATLVSSYLAMKNTCGLCTRKRMIEFFLFRGGN